MYSVLGAELVVSLYGRGLEYGTYHALVIVRPCISLQHGQR